jgi:hypothetical protein
MQAVRKVVALALLTPDPKPREIELVRRNTTRPQPSAAGPRGRLRRVSIVARRAGAAAIALAAVLFSGPSGAPAAASGGETGAFEFLGAIAAPAGVGQQHVAAIDPAERRLYTLTPTPTDTLWAYDLNTEIPSPLWHREVGAGGRTNYTTPFGTAVDHSRRQLVMLAGNVDFNLDAALTMVPLDSDKPVRSVPFAQILPGLFPGGVTYSPEDDLFYVVGEMDEAEVLAAAVGTGGSKPAGQVAVVAALSPVDGALVWSRVVRECRTPLFTPQVGSFIGRSSPRLAQPTLFFACTPGASATGSAFVGQPGVTALRIKPKATMAEAQGFDVDYFPISGSYYNGRASGIAGYDETLDRFFMMSLSNQTPGTWVLDARLNAWVGAVTSPWSNNQGIGWNESNGHFYMVGGSGGAANDDWLLASNATTSPPQNGVVDKGRFGGASIPFVATDPQTARLFVPARNAQGTLNVVRDLTTSSPPAAPLDYDEQTDDVAETTSTFVAFTGDAGGFGSRAVVIGDTATAGGSIPFSPQNATSRAVTAARGPGSIVQAAGAAASAETASIDTHTAQTLRDDPTLPKWPLGTQSCLDGGDGVSTPPEETALGSAAVECSLQTFEAAAQAHQRVDSALGLTVGQSTYENHVKRTAKSGMTSTSSAASSGVHIDVPGAGSIDIGRVSAVATATAHGQTRSGAATWKRTVESLTVKNAAGDVVLNSPGCTTEIKHDGTKATVKHNAADCDQLAEAIRQALQVHMRVYFPTPDVVATPKGAFAAVRQSERDHLNELTVSDQGRLFAGDTTTRRPVPAVQIDIYQDSIERSRRIVQLAAVEADAIYTINRSADDPDCATGACIAGGSDTLADGLSPSSLSASAVADTGPALPAGTDGAITATPGAVRPSAVRGQARIGGPVGYILSRRSLGQGLLMSAFLILAAAAAVNVQRRRLLLRLLGSR